MSDVEAFSLPLPDGIRIGASVVLDDEHPPMVVERFAAAMPEREILAVASWRHPITGARFSITARASAFAPANKAQAHDASRPMCTRSGRFLPEWMVREQPERAARLSAA